MASEEDNVAPTHHAPSSPPPDEQSLSDRFAHACAITPLPKHKKANLPGATEEELRYLVQNDSGEVFMSPDAIWQNNDKTRPTIMSAMHKALRNACQGYDIDIFPPDDFTGQESEAEKERENEQVAGGDDAQKNEEQKGDDGADQDEEFTKRRSFCSMMGIPDFKPMPELRTLTWANSEAKKVIDAFNEETERIHAERAAKEAAEEAALMAKVPKPAQKKPATPPKPTITDDPILWAAQEEATASSVMRDMRARNKKGLWGSKSTRLKPEAAAEMARARVAAAAAAAVMRNEDRGAELVRAETIDSGDFFENLVKGKRDGSFYPMHAKAFQRAMSLDSGPGGKKKKKVAFAADTVFSRKK